jgi:hypothetical protein
MIASPNHVGYLIRRVLCVAARRHLQSKLAMSPQFHDAKTSRRQDFTTPRPCRRRCSPVLMRCTGAPDFERDLDRDLDRELNRSTRLQSRRLVLCRRRRRFSGCVARQSQRPQPRGLFTRGQTGCLVFGRCFLTVEPPLFLLLENRFGSIACPMSVDIQRRYSFWANPPHRTDLPGDRMPSADLPMWVSQPGQRRCGLFVPRRARSCGHATCPKIARCHCKRP